MSDAAKEGRKNRLIAFADDSATHRQLIQMALKKAGFPFMAYESATELIGAMATVSPRVILLDIDMPSVNGFEAATRIRDSYPQLTAPIIFFSARRDKESVRRAKTSGAQDYLVKPFNPTGLIERLDHWSTVRVPARQEG